MTRRRLIGLGIFGGACAGSVFGFQIEAGGHIGAISSLEAAFEAWLFSATAHPSLLLLLFGFGLGFYVVPAVRGHFERRKAARLVFERPTIERTSLGVDSLRLKSAPTLRLARQAVQVASIKVRNCPLNRMEGRTVQRAHVRAELYEADATVPCLVAEYPRWQENTKPRSDEWPADMTPKFLDEHNFRDLPPNNAASTINFAVKLPQDAEMYAFRGAAQMCDNWKERGYELPLDRYRVRLVIEGAGLADPAECWLVLENDGVGGTMRVERDAEGGSWLTSKLRAFRSSRLKSKAA